MLIHENLCDVEKIDLIHAISLAQKMTFQVHVQPHQLTKKWVGEKGRTTRCVSRVKNYMVNTKGLNYNDQKATVHTFSRRHLPVHMTEQQ